MSKVPYGKYGDDKLIFQKSEFLLLVDLPVFILARHSSQFLDFDIAVLHAPTNVSAKPVREAWWAKAQLALSTRKRAAHFPLLMLGDLNAAVGSQTSVGIGDQVSFRE